VNRFELGRYGEEEAVRYLRARGWGILGRNVRCGPRELDIIAVRGRILAFVEVKSRRGQDYGHPLAAITRAKQKEVIRAARVWLQERALPYGTLIRFDAIAVLFSGDRGPEVSHLPDAWRLD